MTVKELITQLERLDNDDVEVICYDDHGTVGEFLDVTSVSLNTDDEPFVAVIHYSDL